MRARYQVHTCPAQRHSSSRKHDTGEPLRICAVHDTCACSEAAEGASIGAPGSKTTHALRVKTSKVVQAPGGPSLAHTGTVMVPTQVPIQALPWCSLGASAISMQLLKMTPYAEPLRQARNLVLEHCRLAEKTASLACARPTHAMARMLRRRRFMQPPVSAAA